MPFYDLMAIFAARMLLLFYPLCEDTIFFLMKDLVIWLFVDLIFYTKDTKVSQRTQRRVFLFTIHISHIRK